MGWTKTRNGDNHIIFHVGKELPEKRQDIVLVPGVQNAQGRGVYCSEEPQLKYSGGEHYQTSLPITPVFCIPMSGKWTKGKLRRDDNKIVYVSRDELGSKVILLRDLAFQDLVSPSGEKVRYYYPSHVSFFREPQEHRFDDRFAREVRDHTINTDNAIEYLKNHSVEEEVPDDVFKSELDRATKEGKIPELIIEPDPETYTEFRRLS